MTLLAEFLHEGLKYIILLAVAVSGVLIGSKLRQKKNAKDNSF